MPRALRDTALKRLKDTYKTSSGLLLPAIERHVMRSMNGDTRPDDHSMQYMHPSDMVKPDWCGRHDYYRIIGAPTERKDPGANPSFRMNNVFAEGHAIHGKWQTWLWEMGYLVGDFKCKECGHRWYDISPKECQFCRSERLEYTRVATAPRAADDRGPRRWCRPRPRAPQPDRDQVDRHPDSARSKHPVCTTGISTVRTSRTSGSRYHTRSAATCARASCISGWRGRRTSRSSSSTSRSFINRPKSSWSNTTRASSLHCWRRRRK